MTSRKAKLEEFNTEPCYVYTTINVKHSRIILSLPSGSLPVFYFIPADVDTMEIEDSNASYGIGQDDAVDTEEITGTLGMEIPIQNMDISEDFFCISATTLLTLKVQIRVAKVKGIVH